jgi:hypothetical protein
MTLLTEFKSRRGILRCSASEAFRFVSDLRNFRQFIHDIRVDDLKIDSDSCSFHISPVGEVKMSISAKVPVKEVHYTGSLLKPDDFLLLLELNENSAGVAEVDLTARADLNPALKMMATKPVEKFLEGLISEMEKFRNWNDIIK